jgi:hypothetical protein
VIEEVERLLKATAAEIVPLLKSRLVAKDFDGKCWRCRRCRRFNGSPRSPMPQGEKM